MIKIENLWFGYNSNDVVLRGINLTIDESEFVAIMGDNGAGKTTLIKHFNGLLKPKRGRVLIDDMDTRKYTVAELSRKVGIVFQYPEKMFFCETVRDEIEFALKNFGFDDKLRKRRVKDVLAMLWLNGLENRSPFTLSGGEQRRLALACVLAWDPKYIVMDEPTAGQDRFQREVLIDVIRTLRNRGKTVIIVTHDVEFVAELKPRVILMKKGEVIADGDAEKVLSCKPSLEQAGLIPPAIFRVSNRLRDRGLNISLTINVTDLIRELDSLLKGTKI